MYERLEYEQDAYQKGKNVIIGLDEAGRGPMAGPLVVAGVIFEKGFYDERINDSKQLSEKKREELYNVIVENALAYEIEVIECGEVDELNVYQASKVGMIRCIEKISLKPDYALTDAMPLGECIEHKSIIKGDALSISIAAASILAKVTRDRLMKDYALKYPEYGFEKHKGYVTKQHKEALETYGVTPIHRRSFKPVQEKMQEQMTLDL